MELTSLRSRSTASGSKLTILDQLLDARASLNPITVELSRSSNRLRIADFLSRLVLISGYVVIVTWITSILVSTGLVLASDDNRALALSILKGSVVNDCIWLVLAAFSWVIAHYLNQERVR